MNVFLVLIIAFLITEWVIAAVLQRLNLKHLTETIPSEFDGMYDSDQYKKSQQYLRDNTRMSMIQSALSLTATLIFILAGGFNQADIYARSFGFGEIGTGLIFIGLLGVLSFILSLPFSIYDTFVIEERYGFNKTTAQTFVMDCIKSIVLSAILGGVILAGVIWFFSAFKETGWLYAWAAVTVFSLVMQFAAPVLIMPLFNRFVPLAEGPLKDMIMDYAQKEKFQLKGIYTMDGSKRSTKLNAYFTGFGKLKRIVFFDTLMTKLDDREIMAVLAHEMGHYALGHILRNMIISAGVTGSMFFLLSLFLDNSALFAAFNMQHASVYAALLFFMFLFSPLNFLISAITNALSRRYEFEADAYSKNTLGDAEALVSALKKLSVENLSNLNPHPAYVFFNFSHPPVLQRIDALRIQS